MAQFNLRDIKKQASFFLREKINDARLALTDVSRIQLLTEEATNEDPWGPETRTMAILADAAFELGEYERIVQVIRNRLDGGKQRPWRQLYKTLVVLEYLLTHGPASTRKEFGEDAFQIEELLQFTFIDKQGIDRGSMVRKIADRVLQLLNDPERWKEECTRARQISFGIRGFGSLKQVSRDDVTQGEGDTVDGLSSSSSRLSEQTATSATDRNTSKRPFKKSFSSLEYLRERLPQLSLQTASAQEDDPGDLEEVSTCLLDGKEGPQAPSQQGLQGEGAELVRHLVTC